MFSAARDNAPPVAVVKPLDQTVNQPNDVILDGSGKLNVWIDMIDE